jgi:hypothetical protein
VLTRVQYDGEAGWWKPVLLPIVAARIESDDGFMPAQTTTTSPPATTGGNGFAVDAKGLQQLPKVIDDVRIGVLGFKGLISTPAAARATGSMPMSIAIGALGLEMIGFLVKTGEALAHDVDTMTKTLKSYEVSEQDVVSLVSGVSGMLTTLVAADRPTLDAGVTSRAPQGQQDRVSTPALTKGP